MQGAALRPDAFRLHSTAKIGLNESANPKGKTMINTKHLLKVTAAWTTIVYVVCFGVVAFIPIRPWFMQYALHMNASLGESVITFATFIYGLLIWNVAALLAVSLFAFVFHKIKK